MNETSQTLNFLNVPGSMAELIRQKDWSGNPIGHPAQWPTTLKQLVNILLNSRFPMFVWWGPELITIYNDAYRIITGDKHPAALGERGPIVWKEIWDVVGPLANQVMQEGIANWSEDQPLQINRTGYVEETYFTFSYSPVYDEKGKIMGVFCACTETTEKVLAARRIFQSENNLRNIILQSPVAMCIFKGPEYIIEIANEKMYELWGRSSEEMQFKPIFEVLPEARNQGFEEKLQQVYFKGETVQDHDVPIMLPRNGKSETVYIDYVYEPFREGNKDISGVIAVAIDVTHQALYLKKIEESEQLLQQRVIERTAELQKQNNLLDNILTHSSNGISVTEMIRDEQGNVYDAYTIIANEAAVKFTGLPKDIYLTKTALELDPELAKTDYFEKCMHTLKSGEPTLSQYFLDFSKKWLEVTVSRMDENHLIHIFTDITSIKEAQIQLERTIEELKRSNANLEEFAYAASHDLKEPIRKIQLFSDRLRKKLQHGLKDEETALFDKMDHASIRMRTLIDDLLEYSHVSEGISEREPIDLNENLQTVLQDLEIKIEEKKATINIDPLPVINGNKRQIQQLFLNLLSNALKYNQPNQSPAISITSDIVEGRATGLMLSGQEALQKFYRIEVKDNGIGFKPEDSERIFDVFIRLHGNNEYSGTGVGLSIAKKVVLNHKGFIVAESVPNEGATFRILFPL